MWRAIRRWFAHALGCGVNSLKNWISGYNRPSPQWREKLATAVGIDEGEWYIPAIDVGPTTANAT